MPYRIPDIDTVRHGMKTVSRRHRVEIDKENNNPSAWEPFQPAEISYENIRPDDGSRSSTQACVLVAVGE